MSHAPNPQTGDLVGIRDSRGHHLAVVRGVRGNRIELCVGLEHRQQQSPSRDLELIAALPSSVANPPRHLTDAPWAFSLAALGAARPTARSFGEAWLLLSEEAPSAAVVSLQDLAGLLGDGTDPSLLAACWLWLQGDQTLFRCRQGRIEPRSAAELRPLRQERHRLKLQSQRREHWRNLLLARQPINAHTLSIAQQQELNLLRRWAADDTDQPLTPELLKLLRDGSIDPDPGAIRHLLVDLGQWERHHLPSLEASAWQLGFSDELLKEADRLVRDAAASHPGDERRIDRSDQHVVTIDDEDTRDIDDGLALETMADGRTRLWIHIADPDRLVAAGTPLDLEARRRASSLYLAQGNRPMFPPQLAHGPMSLRSGERCAAWSLWVAFDERGGVLADGLERTWIRPAYRLSYADADDLIELAPPQEADLLAIHALLDKRRRWRTAQGALQLEDPEGRIRCRGEYAEVEVVEPSSSRRMVAEAMVLAGALVAERGMRDGLALPYRSQAACALPSPAELDQLPAGPVRHAAIKRCLTRGLVGTTPAPHFSLGLPAYVQATSPIRRYGDLLVQRQLQAVLDGRDPLPEHAVASLVQELEIPLRQGIQIGREDQRHWLQVWFEQQERRQWPGQFLRWLRQDHQLALVWLEDLCQSLPCVCPPRSEPADSLVVRLVEVDSLRDRLRLEAAG